MYHVHGHMDTYIKIFQYIISIIYSIYHLYYLSSHLYIIYHLFQYTINISIYHLSSYLSSIYINVSHLPIHLLENRPLV